MSFWDIMGFTAMALLGLGFIYGLLYSYKESEGMTWFAAIATIVLTLAIIAGVLFAASGIVYLIYWLVTK